MTDQSQKRVVAIVGRPNVGKSALFNRLVGRRLAIVHEESGVTRDRIAAEAIWDNQRVEIIDTGGVGLMDRESAVDQIERGTRVQVDIAISDAAVVVFVTDITAGVAPLDEEVARLLHASGRTVFLAANKADNIVKDAQTVEFERLGFPVFPISAAHNRGVADLMDRVVAALPEGSSRAEDVPALQVAIVGRPNVGKSSYINQMLGSDRVIVSEVPGTTRDSIEIPFEIGEGAAARRYVLIDTAGMRKVGKVHNSVERFSVFRAEKSIERADIVLLMFDAGEGPTVQDKKIAATILECRKGCILVVNKWDLAEGVTQRVYEKALLKEMFFLSYAPVVFLSAKTGHNVRQSIDVIDHVAGQVSTELTTGLLNRTMRDAFEKVQPPDIKGHRLKFYYCTQTGVKPLWIRIFVNDPRLATDAYRQYLSKALRRAFGLEGAPFVLDFKSSHKPKTTTGATRPSPRRKKTH